MSWKIGQNFGFDTDQLQMSIDISFDANLSFEETNDEYPSQPNIYLMTPDRANAKLVATPQNKLDFENFPKNLFNKSENKSISEFPDFSKNQTNEDPDYGKIQNFEGKEIRLNYKSFPSYQQNDVTTASIRQPLTECSNQQNQIAEPKRKHPKAKNLFSQNLKIGTTHPSADFDVFHADSMPEFPVQQENVRLIFSVPLVPIDRLYSFSQDEFPTELETPHFLLEDPTCNSVFTTEPDNNEGVVFLEPSTLSDILNGKTKILVENVIIIDCRYPYEFEGGHIKNAINIYTKQGILDYFFKNSPNLLFKNNNFNPNLVLIFHCEFSQNRGPTLAKFLRNQDRNIHTRCYPKLFYPQIYILKGGYKSLFESHQNLCYPEQYIQMMDPNFNLQYARFKKEQKTSVNEIPAAVGMRNR